MELISTLAGHRRDAEVTKGNQGGEKKRLNSYTDILY